MGIYIYQYIYPSKNIKLSLKYAIYYLTLIFVFGLIYFDFTPDLFIDSKGKYMQLYSDLGESPHNLKIFTMSMYYSVVTITTLGFGDISPNSLPSIILTLIESILGIIFIGFFLNSLSHERSQKEEEEREKIIVAEEKKYKLKLIEEEKKKEREIILKFYPKLMSCYIQFNNLLRDIYFGPSSNIDYDKHKNNGKFGIFFIKNFKYELFENLEEKSLLYMFAGYKINKSIRMNINSLKILINDIVFNYYFIHYKEIQSFFEGWVEILDKDYYLNPLEIPLDSDKKEELKKLVYDEKVTSNDILYSYTILKLILFHNIHQYAELIEKIEKLKEEQKLNLMKNRKSSVYD